MQAALGCHAPAGQIPASARWRTYTPPCAPSSSGRLHSRLIARAGKDGKDDKSKRTEEKADFSALWALRIKNFFSSRRKYLQQAEQPTEDVEEKAAEAAMAREEAKLRKMREEVMELREAELRQEERPGDLRESLVASDIARARLDLQSSPVTKATLAVVRVREFLRAVLMLPFSLTAAAVQSWQGLFNSQRYENFLMSEGERMWYWRNRMEDERWFWEVLVWDRLLFPIIAIISYEWLVPNHFLWAVVAPVALLGWLTGRLATPATPEFWMIAYFGFYRKCWPDFSGWLANNVLPLLIW
ncbi:hypothetical protein VOLCADRAFT_120477 [Volvox carteri f. nagariensis]|uniref:Uncharacterized protein n=1 Tax=Volvox carteri f. nagariensis TaxID=3068 RepID=D8TM76_VOLCA|nr:uncharacterized protein VOLCADRAFT_120477 [Volvox carteri f. nagariensis]EFJ51594.1 hypothetical protein VOLCADRAFT_120477 [Volvox carteri f. nagariensis]|eukprot:XP_002947546.1 hypothetical protein VOLCADRAFT_120477 [Volvox carteri f. nagariensis]